MKSSSSSFSSFVLDLTVRVLEDEDEDEGRAGKIKKASHEQERSIPLTEPKRSGKKSTSPWWVPKGARAAR
jgi:hypothetical protein